MIDSSASAEPYLLPCRIFRDGLWVAKRGYILAVGRAVPRPHATAAPPGPVAGGGPSAPSHMRTSGTTSLVRLRLSTCLGGFRAVFDVYLSYLCGSRDGTGDKMTTTRIILFYQYSPLSEDDSLMANLRDAFERLCQRLNLLGRILLGKSRNEGINGTLSGSEDALNAFIVAMLGRNQFHHQPSKVLEAIDEEFLAAIESFWDSNESFAQNAQVSTFTVDSWEDFKWSECRGKRENKHIFPDLYVKVVEELIGTGGVLSSISLSEVNQGYLTPEEFHQQVLQFNKDRSDNAFVAEETILIDCRNHNEHLIGNFLGSLDPNTKTFAQFPKWVQDHKSELDNKKVLMYCTGGKPCMGKTMASFSNAPRIYI